MTFKDHLPAPTLDTVATVLIAGALSLVAFDFYGQSISPMLGQATLAPVPLANAVISTIFGTGYRPGAEFLHYFAGIIAYPLGWLLVARPIAKTVAPWLGWVVPAVAYGVVLWIFALYVMAHLIAGNPPFLGFTGITWVALWGHILFALVTAGVVAQRERSGQFVTMAEAQPA
ncbi:hypothetical protein [Pontivivens ytuae]|uniref:DUF1440 domain-containing protein n=1 Tax=Pontivivens ytuae TaxID=2789856 RepID=A0A7S9LR11_9RHOB|nr:hypothetical protein [Pontivivens ytuae]QPH53531.1 hypothetical protein I0K15_17370 [Pontivivens ytuae]